MKQYIFMHSDWQSEKNLSFDLGIFEVSFTAPSALPWSLLVCNPEASPDPAWLCQYLGILCPAHVEVTAFSCNSITVAWWYGRGSGSYVVQSTIQMQCKVLWLTTGTTPGVSSPSSLSYLAWCYTLLKLYWPENLRALSWAIKKWCLGVLGCFVCVFVVCVFPQQKPFLNCWFCLFLLMVSCLCCYLLHWRVFLHFNSWPATGNKPDQNSPGCFYTKQLRIKQKVVFTLSV